MKAVIQRVTCANVSVDDRIVGAIEHGLVVLIGVTHTDTPALAEAMAHKIAHLRIFEDEAGKLNLSALEVGADLLVVSQFTLYANCKRGRRPDFIAAAKPDVAQPLVRHFVQAMRQAGLAKIEQGVFGARMLVSLHNDGPVTIILDTDEL